MKFIFEDDNILVINKPHNLEVTGKNSLTTIIHEKYKDLNFLPMPCHRIDRNTTGLVLFAKNEKALDILMDKFKRHEIEKHYLALVYGCPKQKYKRNVDYLFKDNKKSLVYISDDFKPGYQKIITSYSVIKEFNNTGSIKIKENIISLLNKVTIKNNDKICIKEGNKSITYRELSNLTNYISEYLKNNGVKKGDVISLILNNPKQYN